jgi:hypothetical protein
MQRLTIAILAATLPACTLAMMAQMSDPVPAKEPKHVEWREVEPLAEQAATAYANRMEATVLATYLTEKAWHEQTNEHGNRERSTGMWLYIHRKGGAAVKGAEGETGVCFQYDCSLVQERVGGWQSPFLDCSDHNMVKVTCKSVRAFTAQSRRR